ncbi:MAG TPA: GNAT family N-acetyltransferase [Jatrophihabitans sp.]|nr:GNAT family N-acetyltransferase [Jatrophihabitans sp.]
MSNSQTGSPSRPQLMLRDGTPVWWRFVEPADRAEFEAGFEQLSDRSRYRRFHQHVTELPEQLWDRLVDQANQHSNIAVLLYAGEHPIAVAHVFRSATDRHTADVAVTVSDDWQGRGAGSLLLREALTVASDVRRIDTQVLLSNTPAVRMLESFGDVEFECVQGHCRAVVQIRQPHPTELTAAGQRSA